MALKSIKYHKILAKYFTTRAKGTDTLQEWETEDYRGFSECVFHFCQAKDYKKAGQLLRNFKFLEKKASCGNDPVTTHYRGVHNLIKDINQFLLTANSSSQKRIIPNEKSSIGQLQELKNFLIEESHRIAFQPQNILQECYNIAQYGALSKLAKNWLAKSEHYHPWIQRLNRQRTVPKVIRIVASDAPVKDVIFTEDSRFLIVGAGIEPLRVWGLEDNLPTVTIDTWNLMIEAMNYRDYKGGRNHDFAIVGQVLGLIIDHSKIALISTQSWEVKIKFLEDVEYLEYLTSSKTKFFVIGDHNLLEFNTDGEILSRSSLSKYLIPTGLAVSQDEATALLTDIYGGVEIMRSNNGLWSSKSLAYIRRINNSLKLVLPENIEASNSNGFEGMSFSLSLDANGRTACCSLCSSRWNGEILIFNVETLENIFCMPNFFGPAKLTLNGDAFAFAGKWIGPWKLLGICSISTGAFKYAALPHSNLLNALTFSPDETLLAVGSLDGSCSVIAVDTMKPINKLPQPESPSKDTIIEGIISNDGKVIACWSIDKYVIGYSLADGCRIFATDRLGIDGSSNIKCIGLSQNNDYIFVNQGWNACSSVRIWRITGKRLELVYDTDLQLRNILSAAGLSFKRVEGDWCERQSEYGCAFSPDGSKAAIVRVGKCVLIELHSGRILYEMELSCEDVQEPIVRMNDKNEVFVKYVSPFRQQIFRWRIGEKYFEKVNYRFENLKETSGHWIEEESRFLGIRYKYGKYSDRRFIAEVYTKHEKEPSNAIASYIANSDISFMGINPAGNRVIIGDHSGDIAICAISRI